MDNNTTPHQDVGEAKPAVATTVSGDQTTDKQGYHLLPASHPSSDINATRSLHLKFESSNGSTSPHSAALVSNLVSSTVLPPSEKQQPGMANTYPASMDTTGQIAPPGIKPRVKAVLWEDEGCLGFSVEVRDVCVARREDNDMINGTKLMSVAGLPKGTRDAILKSEKVRHVVKTGPMHLKGVWIPFERALDFANKEKITELLYPLFAHNISALLYRPTNQTRTNQVMAAAERRRAEAGGQLRNNFVGGHAFPPRVLPSVQPFSYSHDMGLPGGAPSTTPIISFGRPSLDRAHVFPMPPASAESATGKLPSKAYRSRPEAKHIPKPDPIPRDAGASTAGFMPVTPAVSDDDEPSSPNQSGSNELVSRIAGTEEAETHHSDREGPTKTRSPTAIGVSKDEEYCISSDEKDYMNLPPSSLFKSGTVGMRKYNDTSQGLPQLLIVSEQSPGKSSLLEKLSKVTSRIDQPIHTRHAIQITSRRTTGIEVGESKDVNTEIGSLSPSQKSPQSDSEHSSDSEAGLLIRNERKAFLIERLMDYFFGLLSSCPSPVPITTTESPMMPNAGSGRQTTEDERVSAPLPSPRFLYQSMDGKSPLFLTYPKRVYQEDQFGASFFDDDEHHHHKDQYNDPVQDGLDSVVDQSNISASTIASENRQSNASYQSIRSTQKRDREKDDDDKDERRPGKHTRISNDQNNSPKRLACPFFKNDPEHPRLGRSCSGPGWGTVHRLKEHLDRNHALPPSCVRCYTVFGTEADRDTHMRIQDQCQVRERPGRMHGFDAAQKEQLRSRPKGYKHMSETQKWCHIYMILFPETASTEVPSPYYEFVSFRDSGHPVDPMTEYENFLRHEMPDRVRHQLELRIEEALNPLEETLRGQIVDIVRDVQLELFQSFRTSTGPTRPNGDSVQESASIKIDDNPDKSQDEEREGTDAQDSTLVARNTEPPGQFDSGQCSWEEQLEAYRQVPPLDFSFTDFDDFDGALFDFSSVIPAAQDSAYGTLSISQEETDKEEFIGNETGM